jgi:AraC family transcriptional regulator
MASETTYHLDDLCFEEVSYASDLRMPSHSHEEASLILLLQGRVQLDCRKESSMACPSTLTFLPAGEAHANHFYEGVKTFQIKVGAQWLERLREISAFADTPIDYHNSLPTWLAMRLYREFQRRDNLTSLMLEGLTLELLAELARYPTNITDSHIPRWLKQAQDFLFAHFTESLSLELIADSVGVHPSHLTRAFRRHYHCTLGDYVRKLRVEYACHLLSTSTKPLSHIALDSGFADQGHFSRTFKHLTGMTPAQFRRVSGRAGLR